MQKLVGTELYVFDLTPFEITQQTGDATVIFVQNECIDGYKEFNASLADKIKGFNQFVLCVTDPWAGGVEPSPEPPTPTTYTFSLGGYDIHSHVELYFDDVQQEVHPESYDVAAGTSIKVVPTEDTSYYTLISGAEWDSDLSAWVATMPEANYSINIDYSEPPVTHTVTFDVQGTELCRITDELDSDAGEIDNPESPVNVEAGKYFKMFTNDQYLETDQNYTITGVQATFVPASQSYNTYSFFYFVMPDEDVTFSVTYEEPKQDPELSWSANSATVTIGADDNVFPALSNPHDIIDGLTYSSTFPEIADIDSHGNISLVMSGETEISAIFEGDETYNASTVSYELTVEGSNGESGSSGSSDDQ